MNSPSWKKWVLSVLGGIGAIQILVVALNVAMDPLWCFGFYSSWNDLSEGFDERQQKTNYVNFLPFSHDAILLGSSRVTYISPSEVPGRSFFNYAVSSMKPREYAPFVDFAQSRQGRPFRLIILGVDFFGTNGRLRSLDAFAPPKTYIERAQSPFSRWSTATSFGALRHSLEDLALNVGWKNPDGDYRRRDLSRVFLAPDQGEKQRVVEEQRAYYKEHIYGDYFYDSPYEDYASLLKNRSSTEFKVFTTPESAVLLQVLLEEGRWEDYARWMRELVEAFGVVWNFMYVNRITAELGNYKDAHHFSPQVGEYIMQRLLGIPYEGPEDFGLLIDASNLEEHLSWVRRNIGELRKTSVDP